MGYKHTSDTPAHHPNNTAIMPKDCTIHLFSLKPSVYLGAGEVIAQVAKEEHLPLRPHAVDRHPPAAEQGQGTRA
jgi:hypothetical protein